MFHPHLGNEFRQLPSRAIEHFGGVIYCIRIGICGFLVHAPLDEQHCCGVNHYHDHYVQRVGAAGRFFNSVRKKDMALASMTMGFEAINMLKFNAKGSGNLLLC